MTHDMRTRRGTCPTCNRDEAQFLARLGRDTWPSCLRCKTQGESCGSRVTYEPLPVSQDAA